MKVLRNIVDKIKPTFSKGGKLGFLHSTFDAFETFLFVPNTTTKHGAHVRDCNDIKRTMITVVVALIPCLLFGCYNTGIQVGLQGWTAFLYGLFSILPMIAVSYIVGLGIEFTVAQWRGHEVNEGFLVSGLLIPLVMPVSTPLWMVALGTAFAVIFGKEIFGGTGMNVFNPAVLARAFVFFAYTPQMSGEKVWYSNWEWFGVNAADVATGATALDKAATKGAVALEQVVNNGGIIENNDFVLNSFLGFIPGSFGETSTLAILLGAAILLFTGVASWKTMISVFVGGLAMAYTFDIFGGGALSNPVVDGVAVEGIEPYMHLLIGGFAFGAVFMATDPVTSAQTSTGKYIVGFLTGALAILIREINPAYPEGMMLSILFMNALAPLVDYFVVEANIRRRKNRVKTVK
ncbi:MAG: NADH:ubiquinone reductase (Na(+)-transporting) subunit B [Alistipes sp.]|nr:NADH:ubiquinone reductase (Na(+)-transporting) subunit B [Alistipes sp.]